MKTLMRILLALCILACLASFLFGVSFYYRHLPSKPQPEIGRTYTLNNHGFPVYLTKQEHVEQRLAVAFFALFAISGAIIDYYLDPFEWKRSACGNKATSQSNDTKP